MKLFEALKRFAVDAAIPGGGEAKVESYRANSGAI